MRHEIPILICLTITGIEIMFLAILFHHGIRMFSHEESLITNQAIEFVNILQRILLKNASMQRKFLITSQRKYSQTQA